MAHLWSRKWLYISLLLFFKGYSSLILGMDPKSTVVVGAEKTEDSAYMRVNCEEMDHIVLGDLSCYKDISPCYARINEAKINDELKWCITITDEEGTQKNVSQCNMEVSPFKGKPHVISESFMKSFNMFLEVFKMLN